MTGMIRMKVNNRNDIKGEREVNNRNNMKIRMYRKKKVNKLKEKRS